MVAAGFWVSPQFWRKKQENHTCTHIFMSDTSFIKMEQLREKRFRIPSVFQIAG